MSKKILAGVGVAAALGVAILPSVGTFAVGTTTYIKATVEQFVGCSSSNDTSSTALDLGNIAAGSAKTGTFRLTGSTNDPKGFNITSDTINPLVNTSDATSSIAYSASAVAAGTQGYYLAAATGFTTGATIGAGASFNSAATGIANPRDNYWDVNATVSTATTTTVGTYLGSIEWLCSIND